MYNVIKFKLHHNNKPTKITDSVIFLKQPGFQIISEPSRTPWLLISMLKVLKEIGRIFLIALKTCHNSSGCVLKEIIQCCQKDI